MIPLDEYKTELGVRVRTLRDATGMSLRAFGLMVDVHYNQLNRIEKGQVNPTLETLYKIAEGLEVSISDLLE